MRIEFSQSFEDIQERLSDISRKDVIRAVTNPLIKQSLRFDDLELLLFVQKERQAADSYILVMGRRLKDNTLHDVQCFRILGDLVRAAGITEPVMLLQQLAYSFGAPIRIGKHTSKFFFREIVPIPKDFKTQELFRLFDGKRGMASGYFKIEEGQFQCAMVFSVDIDSYLSWIKGKEKIEVGEKTYDLFISYERNTARDFGLHLKSSLTREGFRAFCDLTDIPKESSGTTKWFSVRDDAITGSRRFLLIVTIGIQSSVEVAKELFLARKVPDMKFILMRHEALEPRIMIEHGGEKIDLSEFNQERFETKEDLARRVLKILSKPEIERI